MLAGDADEYDMKSVRGIESWSINQRTCILYEGGEGASYSVTTVKDRHEL